ncbi:Sterol carrier protein 2 [Aduncisulcus paluster]|uniref:propanoyl-CoA C-acyltransferase n=1 Tax=Aduncisulcus paluster TaxID=2918883 RepID=A0ABQ5KZF2_9EUKA|nr:Sterol carrier protein 2 [Aduncisulcus paluster]
MERGSLSMKFTDRESPLLPQLNRLGELTPPQMPMTAWMFAAAAEEYMREYGLTAEQLAWIGYKNHKHSVNNPYSQFQDEYSLEDILSSRSIVAPLTKLHEEFVDKHGLADQAVEIVGQSTVTDRADTFDGTAAGIVGAHMNKAAVQAVYEQAQIGPEDIDVIELHDCFSANEILVYEALGLCEQGEAGKLIDNEDTTFGGKWVVNPSGGLISKGHPLGATGLAQCAELNWQLRGLADKRQVASAATKNGVALQHNIGLGGSVVVTAYRPAQR